jgi:hypothetical protein
MASPAPKSQVRVTGALPSLGALGVKVGVVLIPLRIWLPL